MHAPDQPPSHNPLRGGSDLPGPANSPRVSTGQFAITPEASEVITKQLTAVQDTVEKLMRGAEGLCWLPALGGGFAQEIGMFNERLAAGEPNSAQEVLTGFRREIETLKEDVASSVRNYQRDDSSGAGTIESAGRPPE